MPNAVSGAAPNLASKFFLFLTSSRWEQGRSLYVQLEEEEEEEEEEMKYASGVLVIGVQEF